jgi:hypothetical protein
MIVVVPTGPDRVGTAIEARHTEAHDGALIDLDWRSPVTGGPLTTVQHSRFSQHLSVWRSFADNDGADADDADDRDVVVLVEQRVMLEPDWLERCDEAVDLMAQSSTSVMVLCADASGPSFGAYGLTRAAAADLCDAADFGARSVEALIPDVVEQISIAERPMARTDAPPSGTEPAAVVHIVGDVDALMALVPQRSDELVLLLCDGDTVDVSHRDVIAQAGSQLIVDHAGRGCLGPVLLAQAWAANRVGLDSSATDPVATDSVATDSVALDALDVSFDDEPPLVDHFIVNDPDESVMVLGNRWRNVDAGRDMVASGVVARSVTDSLVHEQADDVARLLGYRDAVASSPLRWLHTDVVALGLWTPTMCRTVIRAAEAANEWASDPDDPVPGNEVSLSRISPILYESLAAHLSGVILPELNTVWPLVEFGGLVDAFVIRYLPSHQRELRVHHDIAQLSSAVRLNDGFDGGVLEFPRQALTNDSVAVGELLAWPSLVTHPHRSTPVTAGVKYSLTIWWDTPDGRRASGGSGYSNS